MKMQRINEVLSILANGAGSEVVFCNTENFLIKGVIDAAYHGQDEPRQQQKSDKREVFDAFISKSAYAQYRTCA